MATPSFISDQNLLIFNAGTSNVQSTISTVATWNDVMSLPSVLIVRTAIHRLRLFLTRNPSGEGVTYFGHKSVAETTWPYLCNVISYCDITDGSLRSLPSVVGSVSWTRIPK